MTFFEIYLTAGLIILVAMTALWVLSLILRDASIVDIFWGTGFVITAWVYFSLTPEGFPGRKWLISPGDNLGAAALRVHTVAQLGKR